jgi:hypothetical protein
MAPIPQPACASCGEPLTGRFCSHCGEEVADPHLQTLRHFFTHTILHGVTELDGTIWRTLRRLMFAPGFLPSEYAAGRRKLYVQPLRLLITAIIVYALATRGGLQIALFLGPVTLSVAPVALKEGMSVADTVEHIDRFHLLGHLLQEKEASHELESEAAREKFHANLEKFAEPLSFANVLMLAFVLSALFCRSRRYFVQHGVFSLTYLSFVLFSSVFFRIVLLFSKYGLNAIALPLIAAGVIWQFTYLAIAIRRFYLGQDKRRFVPPLWATGASVLVYLLNSVFITAVQTAGAALALWRL